MRFLSLFSGIEAASAAWAPLGWTCVAVSEIDKFANEVLRCRHPNVRNLGDVTKITETDIASLGDIDVVIFGSPCQDLSIAGKRKGLDGARSGLFFDAMRILAWSRFWCGTRFAVWENVPGAFSSNKGCDFAAVVDALSGLDGTPVPLKGWGTEGCAVGPEAMVEWAVLDAQYFGVAQRRRRVFAVADFGNWAGREPILLEPQGLRGDSAPRREAGKSITGTLTARPQGSGRLGTDFDLSGGLVPGIAQCLTSGTGMRYDPETETIIPVVVVAFHSNAQADQLPAAGRDTSVSDSLTCSQYAAVAFDTTQITSPLNYSNPKPGDPCHPLAAGAHPPSVVTGKHVRRLTPVECERLQGFPDGHTDVRAGGTPDGPRYKALGNSMAVPVIEWIGRRIENAVLFGE